MTVRTRVLVGAVMSLAVVLGATAWTMVGGAGSDEGSDEAGTVDPAGEEAGPGADRVTLAFTGDTLVHGAVLDRAAANAARAGAPGYDFGPMFDLVRPRLEAADLAVCHLEVPLDTDHQGLSSYPVFNSPPEVATALVGAGYDACSVASNHAMDAGESGILSTIEVLDQHGLGHDGTARSPAERDEPTVYRTASGVGVGHVSATYGLNGFDPPADRAWLVDRIDVGRIITDAEAARAAGADIVVVSLHWGVEYRRDPTPEQRRVAEALAASPAVDLLVGHHAHVVQPVERVGDLVVVYGLGNFLSNQSAECCPADTQDGVLVEVDLADHGGRYEVRDVRWQPTWVDRTSYTVVPVTADAPDPVHAASAARTDARVRPGVESLHDLERRVAERVLAALAGGR